MQFVETLVEIILAIAGLYLLAGVVAAVVLHRRLGRLDGAVTGGGILFRLIITPGLVALWPLLIGRTVLPETEQSATARQLRTRQRVLTQLVAVMVPIAVAVAMVARPGTAVNGTLLPANLQQSPPLAVVVSEDTNPFPGHAVTARFRRDRMGLHHQVELEVREKLQPKRPMLYFAPEAAAGEIALASLYLGPIPGEGTFRYAIPEEVAERPGYLLVYYADDASGI